MSEVGIRVPILHVLERQHPTDFLTSVLEGLRDASLCGTRVSLDGDVNAGLLLGLSGILPCTASLEYCFSPSNLAPCFVMPYRLEKLPPKCCGVDGKISYGNLFSY